MVNVMKGILVKCDPAMKQFLLHLDETLKLGRKFIIQDLDEGHLFISGDILETLQAKIDDLMDQISFPLVEKNFPIVNMKAIQRGSNRLKENERQRIIDDSTRRRRLRKFLENLEADNFHEDPHADLVMSKKVPKFDDNLESRTRSKKKERNPEYYQIKYRKSFQQMVEDDRKEAEESGRVSYTDVAAPPNDFPPFYTCAVCGYNSNYICVSCGVRVCQSRCFDTHFETRCLKWTG